VSGSVSVGGGIGWSKGQRVGFGFLFIIKLGVEYCITNSSFFLFSFLIYILFINYQLSCATCGTRN
jgi:hypothetical protein